MTQPFYSFDTSAFINGRRDLLPPDVFPTLWSSIEKMIDDGSVRAIEEVQRELNKRDDETKMWAAAQAGLFSPLDEDVQVAVSDTLRAHPLMMSRGGGRNAADPFVIALARARGGIVVTEETLSSNDAKPRIPNVCRALGVRCIGLVSFVRDQGWTF